LTFPDGAIASDAMPLSATGDDDTDLAHSWPVPETAFTHPRSAGCFSRVLGPLTRDAGLFSLSEAIRRCTLVPARILEGCSPAMRRKGRLQVDCDADILVFDPATITDRATFEQVRTSEGVHTLLVAGVCVIDNGEYQDHQAAGQAVYGRPPRHAIETTGAC
jgi:N-acyl-D-aspartate/D-glutamate deacylase